MWTIRSKGARVDIQKDLDQGCGSAFISSGSGSSIFGWIPFRIQYGSRALMTKNWKKLQVKKKIFGSKTTIYLSPVLHKERPSYRRSLQLSKEAIQHFKTWTEKKNSTFVANFCTPGSGSGSTDPIESESATLILILGILEGWLSTPWPSRAAQRVSGHHGPRICLSGHHLVSFRR